MNQNLKKQGLLLLVSKYINEPSSSLLDFMKANQLYSNTLAQSMHSNFETGLRSDQVQANREEYGSNVREAQENAKWIFLKKIASKQLLKMKNIFIFVMLFFEIICGKVYKMKEMEQAGVTILIVSVISLVIKIGARIREKNNLEQQKNIRNLKKYYVYRENQKIQVYENGIVVGDILLVDFSQPIPVSGILLTEDQEIEMDQNLYGKNIQVKKPIQYCLKVIENKNQLQLRIETELGRLPTPIILRGTTSTDNSWFKMLVLCVQETEILEKCSLKIQKQRGVSVIEDWIKSTTKLMRKITTAIITFILIFHMLAIIFKIKALPKGKFDLLAIALNSNIQTFLSISLLIDPSLLKDLLRGSYTKVVSMLRNYKDIDSYLAVEQIFLTEQSVFKYDQIKINKVIVADLLQPVDANLLPALKPQQSYPLFYEIMAGVNLGQDLYKPQNIKIHKNTITHKINYHQRILTSLYSGEKEKEKPQSKSINQGDSVIQLLKTQGRMNLQAKNSNKINPSIQNYQLLKHSISLKSQLKQEKKVSIMRQHEQKSQKQGSSEEKSGQKLQLDDYISKFCHFSAHSLVQGINVLAKNRSRTYCFQSFSVERLQNVTYIWSESRFKPKDRKLVQRIHQNIRSIQRSGLKVYLIGFQQGVYPKKYISNLFGAVGVQIKGDQQIQQKLGLLEKSGINSTFIISQIESQSMQLIKKEIQEELINRSWVIRQEDFTSMQKIAQNGGRIICRSCFTTMCKCKPKNYQLVNPQGFLQATYNMKCIWDVDEDDRKYLELGYGQLNMGVIQINGFQQDTKFQLDRILAAQQLINALEEDVSLWLAWLITVVLCLFPFNYLTFDNIFSHSQLYFTLLYFQALILRHQFVGSSSLFAYPHTSNSKRKRQMLGLALKIDLFIFVLVLIGGCYIVISYPSIFNHSYKQQFPIFQCFPLKSFYHNSQIAPIKCIKINEYFIYYAKAPTFIYLYFLFAFTLRSAVNVSQPLSKLNIIYHLFLTTVLISLTYFCSQWLQFATKGLSIIELGVCLGIAVSVVALCFLCRFIILLLKKGQTYQFQLSLGSKRNESAQLLKQFKFGKTSKFNLEKQEFIPKQQID